MAGSVAFLAALLCIFLALGSPIEPFSAPAAPGPHGPASVVDDGRRAAFLARRIRCFRLLRGLPEPFRVYWAAPVLRSPRLRADCVCVSRIRVSALAIYVAGTWFWHVPGVYEIALRSTAGTTSSMFASWPRHCCSGTALCARFRAGPPGRPGCFCRSVAGRRAEHVLSALFTFSSRPLYPLLCRGPRIGGITALEDQAAAGVLMWVPGSVAFLLPLFLLGDTLDVSARDRPVKRVTTTSSPPFVVLADSWPAS